MRTSRGSDQASSTNGRRTFCISSIASSRSRMPEPSSVGVLDRIAPSSSVARTPVSSAVVSNSQVRLSSSLKRDMVCTSTAISPATPAAMRRVTESQTRS